MSELRLWLLRDFAAAYCRSLAETRIFRRCYWIDGLGIDTKSATQSDHAALQPVIDLALALAQESKPIILRGLILTAGSSRRNPARGQLNGHQKKLPTLPKESGLVRASWLEAAATIFDTLAQSPAIFLLNPLGATAFSYEDLSPLYQRTVPTELCLFIPHKQVEAMLCAAQRSPARAGQLTELLRSDRWKTLPTEEEKLSQAVDGWLGLFYRLYAAPFPASCPGHPFAGADRTGCG